MALYIYIYIYTYVTIDSLWIQTGILMRLGFFNQQTRGYDERQKCYVQGG